MPQYQLAPDQLGIACPATRRARTTVRFPAWLARLARNVASVRRRDRPGRAPAAGRIELRDGRCIALQPLEVDAAARFQQFIRGLSPASRAMRFHAAITDVPAPALQALTTADQRQHIAWVAEECAEAGRIVGEARYVVADDAAELALAVADDLQRQGLGRALLRGLLQHAAAMGVRRVWGCVRADNQPMLRLAQSAGLRLRSLPEDPSLVVIERTITGADECPRTEARGAQAAHFGAAPKSASRSTQAGPAIRWIRAYGLATVAALLLPGGILIAIVAGLMRRRRRAGRQATRASAPPTAL